MSKLTVEGDVASLNRNRDRVVVTGRVEGLRIHQPSKHAGAHTPKKPRNQKGRK